MSFYCIINATKTWSWKSTELSILLQSPFLRSGEREAEMDVVINSIKVKNKMFLFIHLVWIHRHRHIYRHGLYSSGVQACL